ncbi:hypothetical protein HIM_02407 [Hirsutella minnesotensis 3608]|nr:hypothetical protein HIM_02407 [Hirsutella minnesotensis 3608]
MDVFDHAVARGMMTLKAATGCLVAKRKLLLTSDPHADLGSSEAAKRVVRWLRSSGAESNLAFLDNGPFVRSLAPFLVAERLEQAAWNWITQSINDKPEALDTTVQVRRVSHLLAELVRVKSQPQYGDLNAAITTILDAEQRFHHHPLLPRILVLPWRSVSWLSTVEAYGRTRPQKSLFDAHLATADLLNEPLTIERAHLNLYDPKSPNQAPALQFFNDRTGLRELLARFSPEKAKVAKLKGMTVVPWIAFLGHDTVNHLTRTGQSRQAEEMEELLRTELPDLFNDAAYPV